MAPVSDRGGLQAVEISVRFEGLMAINELSVTLGDGEILGLIGPNGAGKTTLVNVLTGFQAPTTGHIFLDGQRMTGSTPEAFARAGISRTFQNVRLFTDMSVIENLQVGAINKGLNRRAAQLRAAEVLDWIGMAHKADAGADSLAYSEKRLVGIARGLTMSPRYLLLDEPAARMNETECEDLMARIAAMLREFNCGVLVIEHNMRVIMGVCQKIHVNSSGATISEGSSEDIQSSQKIIGAYLGEKRNRKRRRRS